MSSATESVGAGSALLSAVGLNAVLNTTTLLRAAAVVGNRRHISNHVDANAKCGQSANRRFTARTWSLDFDVKILDALFKCCASSDFRCNLSCERSRFTRTLKSLTTRRSPRQGVALAVRDRNNRVVERGVNVCHTVSDILANFFTDPLGRIIGGGFSHSILSESLIFSVTEQPCADLCGYGRWCESVAHAWANRDDDGNRGSNQCPSIA